VFFDKSQISKNRPNGILVCKSCHKATTYYAEHRDEILAQKKEYGQRPEVKVKRNARERADRKAKKQASAKKARFRKNRKADNE
jgi:hypothetical protein